jgi:hypothetical protein
MSRHAHYADSSWRDGSYPAPRQGIYARRFHSSLRYRTLREFCRLSLLRWQTFDRFEECAYLLEDRDDVCIQSTIFSESPERRLPILRRYDQARGQCVRPSSRKGQMQRIHNSLPIELVVADEKRQIDEILHRLF